MIWLVRLLLLVPSILAGWLVSKEDPRFLVVTFAIALVFLALTSIISLYWPAARPGKWFRPDGDR